MADVYAMSFTNLNYSGLLFQKANVRTPLSSIIGSRRKITNHVEFVTGLEYSSVSSPAQPAISEAASLTAPYATKVTRSQKTNITQIFQETFGVSYAHQANMGTLSGLNAAGQQANPINEFDFQLAARLEKIAADIEFTFIQGTYNKATDDTEVNKTRGLVEAITTNTTDMNGAPLSLWDVAEMQASIAENNAPTTGLCLWVDPVTMFQINADAQQNGLTVVPAARNVNGIALSSVITPLGEVFIYNGMYLPSGTALLLNLDVIAPVEQPVPGKGNFFVEELAKVGAGTKYQVYGEIGLDHGPEWMHGSWTDLATTFTKPDYQKKVFITNTADAPVPTQEVSA